LGHDVNLLTLIRLGKNKQANILLVFLLVKVSAGGQIPISYKYHFEGDLQKSNITTAGQYLVIDYSISELTIESIINDHGQWYRVSIPGHSQTTSAGKPELPVFSRLISIPEGCTFSTKISEIQASKITPSGKKMKGLLFPAQEGETKQVQKQRPEFVIDRGIYANRSTINSDTVKVELLGKIRNKQIANLVISPVRYNPRLNNLEIITSMKVEIIFSHTPDFDTKSAWPESALFSESLTKGILNYNPDDVITGYSDQPVKMIILTDTIFRKHLDPLIRWKTQKGYRINLLFKGEDLAGSTCTELKDSLNKIYNSYAGTEPAPEYLLIIGDVSKVPYYGTGNITDMYYGEFDGLGDYIPDMYIGRLPVTDTTQLKSVIQKIIQYEKFEFADTNSFYSRALITAGKDANYADYMNGHVNYAITNYLTTENKIDNFHFFYPESYTKKDSVMKLIKNGLSFLNYSGHGEAAGWLHLDIKVPDIINFGNQNMYPFVISNACRTAQFNDTSSFGNKMVVSPDKGAIGFIGCSNDSYWDEDFYWAIGTGVPSSTPEYSETGFGIYDRLFHTHGELPSDWYVSMGQVNYAGNLSVSSSLSPRKKYYWETYTLLGDPSIIPIIGRPDSFNIALPDTLPNGITSFSLTLEPFAYIAVSHFDTLWDASFVSPSGSVELKMPGLSNDSCLIVVTGQNKVPIIKTIYFSDIGGEYINLSSSDINDSPGNNNGIADFGETFYLDLTIDNLGMTDAVNLYAILSSDSEWVTINNSVLWIGTLPALSEIFLSYVFGMTIAEDVPDMGIITIDLILKDNETEKHYKIDIPLHAPNLELITCIIDDSVTGNNNCIADPGETFDLIFQVRNFGSSNTTGQINISSTNENLTILEPSVKSGVLQFGEVTSIPVSVKLSESVISGDFVSVLSVLDCTPYIVNKNFSFRVGRIRESFESSSFNIFPWINISPVPWTITATNSVDGIESARSGAISHSSKSSLIIRTVYSEDDTLKFFYRVSSELNYDYLTFKLNGIEIIKKSGDISWEKKEVEVSAGLNVLEWTYQKDNSVSQGADGAWIDLIDFSTSGSVRYIQKDLEVARIVSPENKDQYDYEPVSVKVLNVGKDTINGFFLAYTINNSYPPEVQYFTNTLTPFNDSAIVTFNSEADLSLYGTYDISVYGYGNNDDYVSNDSAFIRIENTTINEFSKVFPNPFNDEIKLVINTRYNGLVRITLTNTSGQCLYDNERELIAGENTISINSHHLSQGIYYLKISGAYIRKVIPLVKIKQ